MHPVTDQPPPKTIVWAESLKPRGNLVLLRELKIRSVGRIALPDHVEGVNQQDAQIFEVLGFGPGAYNTVTGERVPINLEVGQVVVANGFAAFAHPLWRREGICMCAESEIFAVTDFTPADFA